LSRRLTFSPSCVTHSHLFVRIRSPI